MPRTPAGTLPGRSPGPQTRQPVVAEVHPDRGGLARAGPWWGQTGDRGRQRASRPAITSPGSSVQRRGVSDPAMALLCIAAASQVGSALISCSGRRGSGKERPCHLVQRDHLDQLRPRILALGAGLHVGDRGLESVGVEEPGFDQRQSLVENAAQLGEPVDEQRLFDKLGETFPYPGVASVFA